MSVIVDGGWWPPGDGEPDDEWMYAETQLRLVFEDGERVDVVQVTPDGDRGLVSIPVAGLAAVVLEGLAGPGDAMERIAAVVAKSDAA